MKRKIICVILAAILAAVALTACGEKVMELDRIDTGSVKHIGLDDTADEKNAFDIVKRSGIVELVDIYDTAAFTETDEVKAEELTALYRFTFYDFDEKVIGACSISPKGYLFKGDDLTKPYKLTTPFDEEKVKEIISLYDVSKVEAQ
ncbi:MAG: hypothetical protein IJS27_05960 [Ruminococcus sp.]|nr:hypothetical protein [Ruminococcus sp.]MBQ9514488.1 hypothetical protein [Ruminococcus sp.]